MERLRNNFKLYRNYRVKRLKGRVYCGDALEFLQRMASASASIVFLDPPFNLGKKYCDRPPRLDRKPEYLYRQWLSDILHESARILKPGGTLYLYHVPRWAMRIGALIENELEFRHWIAVSMKNGFVRGSRLYPAHYALLMFTKGKPAVFKRPKTSPSKCRHCGNLVKDYGGYRKIIEDKGINLSDIWDDISPVRHASTKHRSANELPSLLFERIMQISGSKGSLFVDPFAGTATGVLLAAKMGMHFACCDLLAANCEIVCNRLDAFQKESAHPKASSKADGNADGDPLATNSINEP